MDIFPKHIMLAGQLVSVKKLLSQKLGKTGWEKEWLDFLEEWYSDNDSIQVQTSGSTGKPKIITLKKDFVAASAQRTIDFFNLKEKDRVLHCLPSRYIAGKLMIVRALIGNFDMHIVDPATNFEFLKTEHFRFAAMVPNQVNKLLDFDNWNLDFLLIGGSAIPRLLEEQLQQIPVKCYSSYAMTETATHIALRNLNGEDTSAFYHCLNEIEVKLSGEGCLQIYMSGLDIPFLQTTDLAKLKDNKTFRILGRSDNVIISGGIKYSPEEIEKKLEPYINAPFLISSLPHDVLGKQLVLIIEIIDKPYTSSNILAICHEHLSKYEIPKHIHFVKKLPLTPNGKINRNAFK